MKDDHPLAKHFPKTPEEARDWEAITVNYALAMRVLAVAHTRIEGAWCAYIDTVPGRNHRAEASEVLANGDKLPERIALVLFPYFSGVPYAH